jgi:hypothetical protein
MPPKQSPNSATSPDRQHAVKEPGDRRNSVDEALLILSRMLGRQAARDWLSADICPVEVNDGE